MSIIDERRQLINERKQLLCRIAHIKEALGNYRAFSHDFGKDQALRASRNSEIAGYKKDAAELYNRIGKL